jgi:steroid delta-isomerase-like uncharacterized protein
MTTTTIVSETLKTARESVVRAHMASENAHAFEETLGTFAHPRYELMATGEVYDGEAAVREYYARSREAFPDQRNEVIAMHHAGDTVIVELDLLGTHGGPLFGIPATGRSFTCRMAAFFFFEGERIVCERVYFDSATILRQIGVMPTG